MSSLGARLTNHINSVLPRGPKRNHFLAMATPDAVAQAKEADSDMFADAHYEWTYSVPMRYDLSAIWAWAVCEEEEPTMVFYTDI